MSDLEVIQEYFARVAVAAASTRSLYAEDCVLHYGGRHALSGDYEGVERILGMFRASADAFGRPLSLRAFDIAASDQHVIALLNARFAPGEPGEQFWMRVVVFRLVEGMIVEQWLFDYDQALLGTLQRGATA
jgi:ketosteroid isomerase-like protein